MRGTRDIISSEARTSLSLTAQMNDDEALPQMKLPLANDVLRNDVGYRPTILGGDDYATGGGGHEV